MRQESTPLELVHLKLPPECSRLFEYSDQIIAEPGENMMKKLHTSTMFRMINRLDSSQLFFEQTKSIFYCRFKTHEMHVEQSSGASARERSENANHFCIK